MLVLLFIFLGFNFLLWQEPATDALRMYAEERKEPRWSYVMWHMGMAVVLSPVWLIMYLTTWIVPGQQRVLMTHYNVAMLSLSFKDTPQDATNFYISCAYMHVVWGMKYYSVNPETNVPTWRRKPLVLLPNTADRVWIEGGRASRPQSAAVAYYHESIKLVKRYE